MLGSPARSERSGVRQAHVGIHWLTLHQDQRKDLVITIGLTYGVRQFIQRRADELGINLRFDGNGFQETAVVEKICGERTSALKVLATLL